jgi:uncharacterized protein YukE
VAGESKVTRSMLAHAATKAENVGEGIAGNLTSLLSDIESSYPAFKGGAGSMLQTVSGELGQELKKLLTALNTMANHVNSSITDYGSTDEDASKEIKTVGEAYGGKGDIVTALLGS